TASDRSSSADPLVTPIVLWGATGQARVLAEFLGALAFEVVALVDGDPAVEAFLPDVPLFRDREALNAWRSARNGDDVFALVAIGGARGAERMRVQSLLREDGY